MKILTNTFLSVVVLAMLSGCATKVVTRQMSAEEAEFEQFVKRNYPGWEPGEVRKANVDMSERDSSDEVSFEELDGVSGDAATDSGAADGAEVVYKEYIVQKGDSLSRIAKKVYGNGRRWYRIKKANAELLKDQDKLVPGMKLQIPEL